MKPETSSRRLKKETRLLVLGKDHQIHHSKVGNFNEYLSQGDLIVVNRSGTLPSSFRGRLKRTGEFVEVRLAAFQGNNPSDLSRWKAFAFGEGDWKMTTEDRQPPPLIFKGEEIVFGEVFSLKVLSVTAGRLLEVKFQGNNLLKNLYQYGKPIQYSYHTEELAVWDQQTLFSGPPISVEPPSASFPLTWDLVLQLRSQGAQIVDLLHGAGISSTGCSYLDRLLPLKEWYQIPAHTANLINETKKQGGKIVAFGTSVLRAMESAWNGQKILSGSDYTELRITPSYTIQSANALLTGMHEVGTSHMKILDSLCPVAQIQRGYEQAEALGYRGHEYGDVTLLDCSA